MPVLLELAILVLPGLQAEKKVRARLHRDEQRLLVLPDVERARSPPDRRRAVQKALYFGFLKQVAQLVSADQLAAGIVDRHHLAVADVVVVGNEELDRSRPLAGQVPKLSPQPQVWVALGLSKRRRRESPSCTTSSVVP